MDIVGQIFQQKLNEIQKRLSRIQIIKMSSDISFQQALAQEQKNVPKINHKPTVTEIKPFIQDSPSQYDSLIHKASQRYGISPDLIKAVIEAESSFNNTAVSKARAMGLMQLMPQTARALGVANPFDAAQNIDGGVKYLRDQLNQFNGSIKLALAAYNWGPGNIKRLGLTDLDDPEQLAALPKETQNYIAKITSHL